MFQVLALCQSETDAGAHWQMVSCELCVSTLFALIQCRPQINSLKASQDNETFFLFADQIGRALGMFSKRQERVSIIIILIPFVRIVEKKIPEFSFRVFVHIVLTNKFYLQFFLISFQFFYKERGDSKLVCTNCQRFVS